LTRSHSCPCAPMRARLCTARACRLQDKGVDLKRRPPKSRPAAPHRRHTPSIGKAARRDSAVHVSLSSDSPVKQPGTRRPHPPVNRRAVEAQGPPIRSEAWSPNISEELRRRAVAPRRRRAEARYIGVQPPPVNTPGLGKNPAPWCRPATAIFASNIGSLDRVERPAHAVQKP
jgi:hypothetical protein